jgi:hypothetical protein
MVLNQYVLDNRRSATKIIGMRRIEAADQVAGWQPAREPAGVAKTDFLRVPISL